jgi:hypothetical protein
VPRLLLLLGAEAEGSVAQRRTSGAGTYATGKIKNREKLVGWL